MFRTYHMDGPPDDWPQLRVGHNTLRSLIPAGLLNEGSYAVAPRAGVYRRYWIVNGDDAVWFDVVKDHFESPFSWIKHPGLSRRCSSGARREVTRMMSSRGRRPVGM